MLDSRERFSPIADLYQRFRPSYPGQLVDWILGTTRLAPPASVADVGCGTGVSTRLFAERGFDVVGVDPNEAMLASARERGGASYRVGEAAATGLPNGSVDLVIAAQAFHWFDSPAALPEFWRILRPGGWCSAFWNLRGSSPFLDEYDRFLRAHSTEYGVLLKPAAALQSIRDSPGVVDVREAEFAHVQVLDREGLFGRAHSSSYVVHGVDDRDAFDRGLGELFDRYQTGGRVEFRYRTAAICWRLVEPGRV